MLVHQLMYQGKDEQIAFFDKQKKITYRQLQQSVKLFRNYFYLQGVRPGDNVGLLAKNSAEFVFSYFAITSLGAVAVPLNFQLVSRELSFIVQDAKMKIVVSMQPLDLNFSEYGYDQEVKQLIIPEFAKEIETIEMQEAPIAEDFDADDLGVIIYTSGTTGYPKGAMLTHNNLISDARAFAELAEITAEDNALCVLPMYHCFAWTCAVLSSLLRGCSVTVVDVFAIRETIATIRDMNVTVVYGIPTMYKLFASWATAEDFANVRLFVSGGASLPKEIMKQFHDKIGKNIVEGYGLSEAAPVVTFNPLNQVKPTSIGKTLPGIAVKIIDDNDNELAVGEIGELAVQGPNVMLGYYNLPEESARALRNGWLHTGDLAYKDAEGYIYIVDRLKDMIITGGENVYPREIEELLYAHPSVSEAAVIGVPDKLRGDAVRAYVVPAEESNVDKKILREYLQENLALYKIPRDFVQIDALPKNSTGKILKKELRELARKNAM